MFIPKPDIELAVSVAGPEAHPLGYFPYRQYIGTVRAPNKRLSGGFRICDLYVEVSSNSSRGVAVWRPLVWAVSKADYHGVSLDEEPSYLDWDWRQALHAAQKLVRENWWEILRKDPITP